MDEKDCLNIVFQKSLSRLGSIKQRTMLPKRRMILMVLLCGVISVVQYQLSAPSTVEQSQSNAGDMPQPGPVRSIDSDRQTPTLQQESMVGKSLQEVYDRVDAENGWDKMQEKTTNNKSNPLPKSAMTIRDYPWRNASELPRPISREMHDQFIVLLKTLMGLLDGANVSYVMGAGSMIGVYAFHDIIPWDDDIDIWVDYRDLPKVKRVLRNPSLRQSYGAQAYWNDRFSREYDLKILMEFPENTRDDEFYRWSYHGDIHFDDLEEEHHLFKFFRNDASSFNNLPWRYPFIDVSYFRQNGTHLWNHKPMRSRIISVHKELFYPIVYRPFSWLKVPTPYDIRRMIQIKFGHLRCRQHLWSHVIENQRDRTKKKSTKCPNLFPYYPVVWPGGWRDGFQEEYLVLDNAAIQSVRVEAPFANETVGQPREFWDVFRISYNTPQQ